MKTKKYKCRKCGGPAVVTKSSEKVKNKKCLKCGHKECVKGCGLRVVKKTKTEKKG